MGKKEAALDTLCMPGMDLSGTQADYELQSQSTDRDEVPDISGAHGGQMEGVEHTSKVAI